MNTAIYAQDTVKSTALQNAIINAVPSADIHAFNDRQLLMRYINEEIPQVMFVELDDGDGYFLISNLLEQYQKINIVAYSLKHQYALDLINTCSGYIGEEPTPEKISETLKNLRYRY